MNEYASESARGPRQHVGDAVLLAVVTEQRRGCILGNALGRFGFEARTLNSHYGERQDGTLRTVGRGRLTPIRPLDLFGQRVGTPRPRNFPRHFWNSERFLPRSKLDSASWR